MQDRPLKATALRYAVARRWFPQLELDVSTYITTSQTAKNITDVDVYAAVPDEFVGFRSVVFDCKTKKGESPISRALWQRGLLERLQADRGICILRTPRIETDHRYTAAQLGVSLLTDVEFDAYATATAGDYKSVKACVAEIDRWDAYYTISKRFSTLEPAMQFSRSGYWMSNSDAESCVRTLFLLNEIRGELDPAHPEHLAIVMDVLALFMHSLARIVAKIFGEYLQPGQRDALSLALLHLLYGGRGTYNHLNRIRRMLVNPETQRPSGLRRGSSHVAAEEPARNVFVGDEAAPTRGVVARKATPPKKELSLPEWERFVELIRQMLDAPIEVAHGPLFAREVAWGCLGAGTGKSDGVSPFAQTLAKESPQGARFTVLALDYLCRATRLPSEFATVLSGRLLLAQSGR